MRIAGRCWLIVICMLVALGAVGCGAKKASSPRSVKAHGSAAQPEPAPQNADKGKAAVANAPSAPVTPPVSSAARPTASELLKQLQNAYRQMPAVRMQGTSETTVTADGKPMGKPAIETASLIFARPNKMVIDTPATRMVADGKSVYNYSPAAKKYMQVSMTPAFLQTMAVGRPGIGTLGLLLGTDYTKMVTSPKLLADEKIGDRDVYVLTFKLKPPGGSKAPVSATQTLWIGKSDTVVYKNRLIVRLDTSSLPKDPKQPKVARLIETTTLNETKSFDANVKVSDATFKFKPPAGAQAVKRPDPNRLLNKPAPDFSYSVAGGSTKRLSDLKGKFVVVDFWGLPMCEAQLPTIQDLSKSLPADAELLAVNLNSEKAAVAQQLEKKGCDFPLAFADTRVAQIATDYSLRALPTVLIVDKKGVVRAQFIGFADAKQIEDKLKAIR